MSKSVYTVTVVGCDDMSTFSIELTDDQAEGVTMVAEASVEVSTYGCQPTLEIRPHNWQ